MSNPRDTRPYDPKRVRSDLEGQYGKDNIKSTTIPKKPNQRVNSNNKKGIEVIHGQNGSKAVKVKYEDPLTGENKLANIAYNERGLPVFDDVSKFTTQIDKSIGYEAQMRKATRDLRKDISEGKRSVNEFTDLQIKQIHAGKEKIDGYTWHHNAVSNNMQLIPESIHKSVKHIGESSLSKGN